MRVGTDARRDDELMAPWERAVWAALDANPDAACGWLTGSRLLGYHDAGSDFDVDLVIVSALDDVKLGGKPVERRGSIDVDLGRGTVRVEYVARDALKQMRMMRAGDVRACLVGEVGSRHRGDGRAFEVLDRLAERLRRTPARLSALKGYCANSLDGWRANGVSEVGAKCLARAAAYAQLVCEDFCRDDRAEVRSSALSNTSRSVRGTFAREPGDGFPRLAGYVERAVEETLGCAKADVPDPLDSEMLDFIDEMLGIGGTSSYDRAVLARSRHAASALDALASEFPATEGETASGRVHAACDEAAWCLRELIDLREGNRKKKERRGYDRPKEKRKERL